MVQFGQYLTMSKTRLPEQATFTPGQPYQADIEVKEAIINPAEVADFILNKIAEEHPEIQVTGIQASSSGVQVQFTTTPLKTLSASTLIAWLPGILALLGLTVVLITVFDLMSRIPSYIWGLLIIGGILVLWGPQIGKMLQPR